VQVAVTAALADLGRITAAVGEHEAMATALTTGRAVDPYSAALIVGQLGLTAEMLSATTAALLRREDEEGWVGGPSAGGAVADALFPVNVATPRAATLLLQNLANEVWLVFTGLDVAATESLVMTGIHGAGVEGAGVEGGSGEGAGVDDATRISLLAPLLDYVTAQIPLPYFSRSDSPWTVETLSHLAAAALAPDLVMFFYPTPDQPQADLGLLGRVYDQLAEAPLLFDLLVRERMQMQATIDWADPASSNAQTELTLVTQLLDDIAVKAKMTEAERGRVWWNLMWWGIGLSSNGVPTLIGEIVVDEVIGLIQELVEDAGYGPMTAEEARDKVLVSQNGDAMWRAATVAGGLYLAGRDAGTFSASDPVPVPDPDAGDDGAGYRARLDAWFDRHPGASANMRAVVEKIWPVKQQAATHNRLLDAAN
ncbi:MAG TPA: hypothetical protein PLV68_07410, partial [Ilumatobacteraceae bacterium]|nr:hypothetical protein [Ilumatobacteraceae bacterium]